MNPAERAMAELAKGSMVVVYDGDEREGEADLVLSARYAKPETIETLRKDAGGLICAAISLEKAKEAGLPFFTDMLEKADVRLSSLVCRKTAYGDKPAFSLPINHCNVYTGITDNDRSLTLRMLDETIRGRMKDFHAQFYSPGHVFLLIGRGIGNRKGHTELALELGRGAGLDGAMVLCEMLGPGRALSKEEAASYARERGLAFVEGKDVVAHFLGQPEPSG
ncbi:MAG: 3,4-dihydroxy-2-butanone-4-phosphate synthase [Candidatus Micrarchaeota archaeon]